MVATTLQVGKDEPKTTLRDNRRDWDVRRRYDSSLEDRNVVTDFLAFQIMITPMMIGIFFLIILAANTVFGFMGLFKSDIGSVRWLGVPQLLLG
ncbi:MAG: hypothetical protein EXR45_01845 [Chloroflexi bacterium]|nr:hypothetical protein [Chloroflexota bacterium]